MGNSKSKKKLKQDEPKSFFDRMHKQEAIQREEVRKRPNDSITNQQTPNQNPGRPPPRPPRTDPQPASVPYDKEAIDRMRIQLKQNPTAFLLNNIMLSIQFLDNYERVLSYLKNDSITETDRQLNDDMAQHQKHVFLPDKLQEIVDAHIYFSDRVPVMENDEIFPRKMYREPKKNIQVLQPQRMYIIHDNIEVNDPGESSDYSTINNAPHYSFVIERSEESGFVKLRKLDTNRKINDNLNFNDSPPSVKLNQLDHIESGAESDISDISKDESETVGSSFMNELKNKVNKPPKAAFKEDENSYDVNSNKIIQNHPKKPFTVHNENESIGERRPSGILKPTSNLVMKGTLIQTKNVKRKIKPKETEEKKSITESESSGYKSSHSPQTESDYGYATITAEGTPKRLEISQLAKVNESTSEIPTRCISIIEVKRIEVDEDDESDEPYETRYGEFQRELFKKVHYLNSRIFMLNFSDLFQLKLAHSLRFNSDSLLNALTQGASIYCNAKNFGSFEVLPAISVTWPSEANEWLHRSRNVIRNPRTSFVYQWPTQDMIGKSRALGGSIVPLGFVPTRGMNPQQGLQWKLTFPTVERYLETCMAHSHVRCYIFSLILFKKFMEIKTSNIGFNSSHIKNHLFWQMEENYARWPEDRLGEVLIIFLKSFYEHLMKSSLPYYFIPKCNLAKGIPKTILLKQQKKLADILESPVMHLLSALRSVKSVKKEFYPVLNYKRLYRILACDDALRLINPNIPREIEGGSDGEDDEYNTDNKIGFWEKAKKEKNPEYHWKRQQLRQIEAKKAAASMVTAQTAPKELIDLKRKIPVFDINRKRLVLEMFIPHFISIAEFSIKFESLKQALMYLEHARRLSTLMIEESSGEGQGREYMAVINEKIETLKTTMIKPTVPKVPRRNESFTNLPSVSGIRQKEADQYVNLHDTSQNIDHHGNYRHGPESPTTKMASVVFADVHVEVDKPKPIRVVSFQKVEEESEDSDDDLEESKL
ncbi:uncharacterized protein LOC143914239 [Arctopsyche grandis]|uniref:uncharacterized protein LOC143914239 n=1 Tax=Arctopsyche grandis TaxID=121162 RepID=UPI00406D8CB2